MNRREPGTICGAVSVRNPTSPFESRFVRAGLVAGDAGSSRLVYAMVFALVVIGIVLIVLAVVVFRRTRVDLDVLAPLERMGNRKWRKGDPEARRQLLDAVRPAGALALSGVEADDAPVDLPPPTTAAVPAEAIEPTSEPPESESLETVAVAAAVDEPIDAAVVSDEEPTAPGEDAAEPGEAVAEPGEEVAPDEGTAALDESAAPDGEAAPNDAATDGSASTANIVDTPVEGIAAVVSDESVDTVEPVESVEPVELVEPGELVEPVEPGAPVDDSVAGH